MEDDTTQPETLYLSDGTPLSRQEWWDRRWVILYTDEGLKAIPYADRPLRQMKYAPVLFSVTLANQEDAERMIGAIEAYCALKQKKATE